MHKLSTNCWWSNIPRLNINMRSAYISKYTHKTFQYRKNFKHTESIPGIQIQHFKDTKKIPLVDEWWREGKKTKTSERKWSQMNSSKTSEHRWSEWNHKISQSKWNLWRNATSEIRTSERETQHAKQKWHNKLEEWTKLEEWMNVGEWLKARETTMAKRRRRNECVQTSESEGEGKV